MNPPTPTPPSPKPNPDHNLTTRELEIAILITDGYTAKEISDRLAIAKSTVEKHKNALYFKLQVSTIIDVARWVLEHKHLEFEVWTKRRRKTTHGGSHHSHH